MLNETTFSVLLQALGITKRKITCDPTLSFSDSLNMPCTIVLGRGEKSPSVKRITAEEEKENMP